MLFATIVSFIYLSFFCATKNRAHVLFCQPELSTKCTVWLCVAEKCSSSAAQYGCILHLVRD